MDEPPRRTGPQPLAPWGPPKANELRHDGWRARSRRGGSILLASGVALGGLWIVPSVLYMGQGDFDALDAVIVGSGLLAALGLVLAGWRRLQESKARPSGR